jgi:alginate O-acetyltransferase complex protein AlgI
MLFPTVSFAAFFTLVFVANWLLMPRFRLWKWFMLAASYVFYAFWDYRYVLLLVACTVVNHVLGGLIARRRSRSARRAILGLTVALNLGMLGWFKFYGFFVTSAAQLLHVFGLQAPLPLLQVTLPLGISFLTFRALTYAIDIYRGTLEPAPALDFAVYLGFFPVIAAGPIVRAAEFLPQLRRPRDPHRIDSSRAFFLIFAGLAKKMLIADYLATHLVNGVFGTPQQFGSLEVLLGIYAYAVQIYCDFSAYSDIAIGISLLLGFELPDNFNAPYTALSLRDFWRRWHMTLSGWLRDYLYIPLGGNRGTRRRTYINIIVTMLLAGLWHGAAWTFVFWGGYHGAGQALGRARGQRRERRGAAEPPDTWQRRLRQRLITFHLVALGWVFFRADSFSNAFSVLGRLVTGLSLHAPAVTGVLVLLIALGIAIQYVPRNATETLQYSFSHLAPAAQGVVIAAGLFALNALGPQGPAAFLYFRF